LLIRNSFKYPLFSGILMPHQATDADFEVPGAPLVGCMTVVYLTAVAAALSIPFLIQSPKKDSPQPPAAHATIDNAVNNHDWAFEFEGIPEYRFSARPGGRDADGNITIIKVSGDDSPTPFSPLGRIEVYEKDTLVETLNLRKGVISPRFTFSLDDALGPGESLTFKPYRNNGTELQYTGTLTHID
jgi:hypothetical protein